MTKKTKTIPMVIYSLEKMHFRVNILPDGYYSVLDSDGANVFGGGYYVRIPALRYFEECAYKYKRRNGLKKLREHLPELTTQIKSNRWLNSCSNI